LENFLYERKDSDFLKLIDFGFSKIWEKNTRMELSCGTLSYAAPEVLHKNYTSQCDLWSLGVIVFILLVGYMPFAGKSEMKQISMIKSGSYIMRKERWDKVSKTAFDFVAKLLIVDPEKRLTAPQALEHPWIQNREAVPEEGVDRQIVESLCNFAHQQKFRRDCMKLMAWSLTAEERAQVREAFLELDTTNSGTVKVTDLKRILEENFDVPEDEILQVRYCMSEGCDLQDEACEISYSEFLAAMMSSRIQLHDTLLKETFRRFDLESTGHISKDDLVKVLGEDADVSTIMAAVDANHDGEISIEEFIGYLKNGAIQDNSLEAVERALSREILANAVAPRLRKRDRVKTWFASLFG